jgi:uncharacterized protein YndB with AHSA1/START domain
MTSTEDRIIEGSPQTDGHWPSMPLLESGASEVHLPRLHLTAARPLVRDRWERLVTDIEIPATADVVWRALVTPEALRQWLAVCRGSLTSEGRDCILDFEDGEFFLCRTVRCVPPNGARGHAELQYLWRWLGIGPAALVTWTLDGSDDATRVVVTEESYNPPADWRTWNGGGWPGILEQLADHLRTGTSWRWPWRRMGPYVQVELAAPPFEAWEMLTSSGAVKHWLQRSHGSLTPGDTMTLVMGDASGTVEFTVHRCADAGQEFPSYMPYLEFDLKRRAWPTELGGRLWIEPAGLGRSLFQVFHYNWENLPSDAQLPERRIITGFWTSAMLRAQGMFYPQTTPPGPHGWA